VLGDRLQVLLLADVPRGDDLPERRTEGAVLEEVDERGGRVLLQDPDGRREVVLLRDEAALDQAAELGKEAGRERGPLGVSRDRNLVPARGDRDAEGLFEEPQIFVVDTEERAEPGFREGERDGVGSDLARLLRPYSTGRETGKSMGGRRCRPRTPLTSRGS
jgi:hypothetical protein